MQMENIFKLASFIVALIGMYTWFETRLQKWKAKTVEPLNILDEKIDQLTKMMKNNTDATAYMIRYRLERNAQRYIARESITFSEQKEMGAMFDQYFGLGFNHVEKSLRDKVMSLPIKENSGCGVSESCRIYRRKEIENEE